MDKWIGITAGTLGIISILVGFLIALFKIISKLDKKFEYMGEALKYRKDENVILIKAVLAICEGLIQLKCNGPVTLCRNALQEYLIKRGE